MTVAEAVLDVQPLGVGINLPPHAVRELTELGLGDELAVLGVQTTELAYYDPAGELVWSEPRGLAAEYRWRQYSVHRGRRQMMLADAVAQRLGPDAIKAGHRLDGSRRQAYGVYAVFQDRRTASQRSLTASLLIGADGIRSTVHADFNPTSSRWPGWQVDALGQAASEYFHGDTGVGLGPHIRPAGSAPSRFYWRLLVRRRTKSLQSNGLSGESRCAGI